jgi:redox-sensitive bicupin YhaK (pirin superfamily)
MVSVRRGDERGRADLGWLDSRHSFSFGDYHDPQHMGFGPLRVINEDRVQPGGGFPTHGHRDMEIVSYVLEGALEHKDSLGNGSVVHPGDVQRMTAGTGIRHSEFNPSSSETLHFLQIWLHPREAGLAPGYEQKTFRDDEKRGVLRLVASGDGRDGSVLIHQDADIYASVLDAGQSIGRPLAAGRRAWVQVIRGEVELDDVRLGAGDGAAIEEQDCIAITAATDGVEFLLFDLP